MGSLKIQDMLKASALLYNRLSFIFKKLKLLRKKNEVGQRGWLSPGNILIGILVHLQMPDMTIKILLEAPVFFFFLYMDIALLLKKKLRQLPTSFLYLRERCF